MIIFKPDKTIKKIYFIEIFNLYCFLMLLTYT